VRSIDPTAFIAPGAWVMGDVTLGPRASVWYGTVLRGDMAGIVVGADSNLQDGVVVHVDEGRPALIGARVGVGHRAVVHGCRVEDDCLIGMGSVLLNGAVIGQGSVVAAGAVVGEGMVVPAGSVVMGVPGRVVRPVDATLQARARSTVDHYLALAARHRAGAFPVVPASM
jgi:carbonic anhydrase/acetyltransferase-like protein (isoleucine patch superfamily)